MGIPEIVWAATREYRRAEDVVQPFIDEFCVVGNNERIAKGGLYQAYRQWCEQTGEKPLSQKSFGVRMEELRFDEYRDKKTRYWLGIDVRSAG